MFAAAWSQMSKLRAATRLSSLSTQLMGNTECETVRDFREVLARKDIDAVFIATGDRWHATAAMMAAEAGKDVYCEKPCGLTIEYCQRVDETMRRTGRIFQAGTQRRTVTHYQRAVQIARDGQLGRLTKLVASVYTPGHDNKWLPAEPTPDRNIVDWNMWLGTGAVASLQQGLRCG